MAAAAGAETGGMVSEMLVTLEPDEPHPGVPWVVVHLTGGPQPLVTWTSAHDDWDAMVEVLAGRRVVLVTEDSWGRGG